MGKGFMEFFEQADADIFCLQEIKLQEGQIDWNKEGYYAYWNYAEKKGYSGTAIFTKEEPLQVTYGLGIEEHDQEGRVITLEFPEYYLITVYTPNSQSELRRLEYRMHWEEDFLAYLKKTTLKPLAPNYENWYAYYHLGILEFRKGNDKIAKDEILKVVEERTDLKLENLKIP